MSLTLKADLTTQFSYLNPKLDIKDFNGQRAFVANEPVLNSEIVAIWGGKVVKESELGEHSGYAHQIEKGFYLISESSELFARSNEPNCHFTGQLTMVAGRDIAAGEVVTFDPFRESVGDKFDEKAWGLLTSLDVEDCDPQLIRDADAIKRYVIELCDLIEMKRFGDCHVVHFGEDDRVAGYSMFQLIETSCISGHFANATNRSYIDVFSCKAYDPEVVEEFTRKFFRGGVTRKTVSNRY